MARLALLLALAAGCSTSGGGTGGPHGKRREEARVRKQEEGLRVGDETRTFTDEKPIPEPTEEEVRAFRRIWALYAEASPRWPLARDRFKRRSEASAYLLSAYLFAHYMAVNAQRDRYPKELVRVKEELVELGDPVAPYLVDMMVLSEIRTPRLREETEGKPFIPDDITRRDCMDMLERMGSTAVPHLLRALGRKDLNAKGRRFCALALGGTGDPRAYEPLVRMLRDDPSWMVRADAATGLGKLGDRRALGPLLEAVKNDPDEAVVRRAGKVRYELLRAEKSKP